MVAWLASEDCLFTTGGVFARAAGHVLVAFRHGTKDEIDEGRMLRGKWRKTNPLSVTRHSSFVLRRQRFSLRLRP